MGLGARGTGGLLAGGGDPQCGQAQLGRLMETRTEEAKAGDDGAGRGGGEMRVRTLVPAEQPLAHVWSSARDSRTTPWLAWSQR